MKKFKKTIALTILAFFALFQVAFAMPPLGGNKLVASGTVTLANMKISAVDTGAFVDFASAAALQDYTGCLLEIADSSGRKIKGYIGADGTGETLSGSELVTNGDFASNVGWTFDSGWVFGAGDADATGVSAGAYVHRTVTTTLGALYKGSFALTAYTCGTSIRFKFAGTLNYITDYSIATKSAYVTSSNASYDSGVGASNNLTCSIDDMSIQRVTAPSATGVLITNDKAGTAQSFAAKDSSFNYSDSSNYTYRIYRTPPVVVASGSYTAAEAKFDLTSTNAFAEFAVDLTAYQTGKHLLCLYDSAGVAAIGHISATPPTALTLSGSELVDGWTNNASFQFETLITAGSDITSGVETGTSGICYKQTTTTAGWLTKITIGVFTLNSGTIPKVGIANDNTIGSTGRDLFSDAAASDFYVTLSSANKYIGFRALAATDFAMSGFSFQRVTDVANTGALIVSTKGGAVRAWVTTGAFNPNSNGSFKVYFLGD